MRISVFFVCQLIMCVILTLFSLLLKKREKKQGASELIYAREMAAYGVSTVAASDAVCGLIDVSVDQVRSSASAGFFKLNNFFVLHS